MGARWASLMLAVLFAASCGSDKQHGATQVTVFVYTDLPVGTEIGGLSELSVQVQEVSGGSSVMMMVGESMPLTLAVEPTDGKHTLPLSFILVPADNDSAPRFMITVNGIGTRREDGEGVVVRQAAIASFRKHEHLDLSIFLRQSCYETLCDEQPDAVCYFQTGACGRIPELDGLHAYEGSAIPEIPANICALQAEYCVDAAFGPPATGPTAQGIRQSSGNATAGNDTWSMRATVGTPTPGGTIANDKWRMNVQVGGQQ